MRKDVAEKENLVTLDDMARFVNAGGKVNSRVGRVHHQRRGAALLPEGIRLTLKNDQLLSLSGGNTALTEAAAARGTDGVNFCMAYGTDGSLYALGLVVLKDTRGVQPIYEPTPIVRSAVLRPTPPSPGS